MKRNYYIFSSGRLIRKQNTLYFEEGVIDEPLEVNEDDIEIIDSGLQEQTDDDTQKDEADSSAYSEPRKILRKPIPIDAIESIYCFSELRLNTRFINFIGKHNITLHFFNYYGYYTGSFYPREPFISGKLLVQQVNSYTNNEARVSLAQKFVKGASDNILKNLMYYNNRGRDMEPFLERIRSLQKEIQSTALIPELMGLEGNIRALYYEAWPLIFQNPVEFTKREKNPPTNAINALISFGNALVYTAVLSEIYKTQLNPLISYLHEPGERRFSLSLDIAEIFKPLLSDRIIFSLINKKIIKDDMFFKELNFCYLTEEGRKLFVKEFDEKIKKTIRHRTLKKQVSYRHLIRLECYKIIKHLLGDKEYDPFTIWW